MAFVMLFNEEGEVHFKDKIIRRLCKATGGFELVE